MQCLTEHILSSVSEDDTYMTDQAASRIPEECPEEIALLMEQCLEQDPDSRPTARAIVERLLQLSTDEHILASRGGGYFD